MTLRLLLVLLFLPALTSCIGTGSFVSKSSSGNLAIFVDAPESADVGQVRLFVDDQFIGNASSRFPVLHVREGERVVRAELAGFATYEETLLVLGDPNHQVLNIVFREN